MSGEKPKSWGEILFTLVFAGAFMLGVTGIAHWLWPDEHKRQPPPDVAVPSSPADEPDQVRTGRRYQIDSHTWATTALIDGRVYLVLWNDAGHAVSAVAVPKRENMGPIQ